ncbi:hypothetical protein E2320_012355 [Naja naja]|nr:hypothetical protein E2320_012355 [Naja naja]
MSSGSSNNDFGNKNFTESTCLLKLHKNDSNEEILIFLTPSTQLDSKDTTCEETMKEMDTEPKTLNCKKGCPDEYNLRPTPSKAVGKSPDVGKHCKLLKTSNSQTEINQPKPQRRSHSENERTSSKHQTKPSVKNGNVLSCELNSDLKDVELPIKGQLPRCLRNLQQIETFTKTIVD